MPLSAPQEPPKQPQSQAQVSHLPQQPSMPPQSQGPPHQVPSSMGMMNGSQMQHVHGGGKPQQMPPNFGPAALFNHFSSIFDNNNQVSV